MTLEEKSLEGGLHAICLKLSGLPATASGSPQVPASPGRGGLSPGGRPEPLFFLIYCMQMFIVLSHIHFYMPSFITQW